MCLRISVVARYRFTVKSAKNVLYQNLSYHILHAVHKNNIYKNARRVMHMENICLSAIFLISNDFFFYT